MGAGGGRAGGRLQPLDGAPRPPPQTGRQRRRGGVERSDGAACRRLPEGERGEAASRRLGCMSRQRRAGARAASHRRGRGGINQFGWPPPLQHRLPSRPPLPPRLPLPNPAFWRPVRMADQTGASTPSCQTKRRRGRAVMSFPGRAETIFYRVAGTFFSRAAGVREGVPCTPSVCPTELDGGKPAATACAVFLPTAGEGGGGC